MLTHQPKSISKTSLRQGLLFRSTLAVTLIVLLIPGRSQTAHELVSSHYENFEKPGIDLQDLVLADSVGVSQERLGNPVYFRIPRPYIDQLIAQRNSVISITLPVVENTLSELKLIRIEPYTKDFQVRLKTSDKNIYSGNEVGNFYKGTIDDRIDSWVSFATYNSTMRLLIVTPEGNFNFGPVQGYEDIYVMINDRELGTSNWHCQANDDQYGTTQMTSSMATGRALNSTIECYWVADYDFYTLHQFNVNWTMNSMIALFNEMSALYAQEGISISLADVSIYNLPDLYDEVNVINAYNAFGWDLHNNDPYFDEDLGMLIAYAWNGQLAGLATIDALCAQYNAFTNPTRGRFSYSRVNDYYFNYPVYSWTLAVVAHETGHNLGSRHTHWCGWPGGPIDGCEAPEPDNNGLPCAPGPIPPNGGTLMSYCHNNHFMNLALGFGSFPLAAVTQVIQEAMSECLCPSTNIQETPLTAGAKIKIYPNPTQDILYISGYEVEDLVVSIYDGSRRLLKMSHSATVDVSDLNPGAYFVLIETPTQSIQTAQFIKQ